MGTERTRRAWMAWACLACGCLAPAALCAQSNDGAAAQGDAGASRDPSASDGGAPPADGAAAGAAPTGGGTSPDSTPALEEARARLARGEALYEAGDYDGALVEFERVLAFLDGDPRQPLARFNIARCEERLFHYDRAIEHYEAYLAAPDPGGLFVDRARASLSTLLGLLGAVRLRVHSRGQAPAGARYRVFVDQREVGSSLTRLRVPSGRHLVEVRAAGFLPAAAPVNVAAGEVVELDLDLSRVSEGLSPEAFVVALASAPILLAVSSILGAVALGESDALNRCYADEVCFYAQGYHEAATRAAAEDRVTALAVGTDVILAAAGAAAVTALVLGLLTDFGRDDRASAGHARALALGAGIAADAEGVLAIVRGAL